MTLHQKPPLPGIDHPWGHAPEAGTVTEVAPGISIEHDILPHMGFEPIIRSPRPMPAHLFA